jgi:hypothetical protein
MRLEAAGFRVGTVEEFLGMTAEEIALAYGTTADDAVREAEALEWAEARLEDGVDAAG